ncbi:MAG: CDP-alcohol phosphatidyltransferase family protein [Ignavibacteriae bacterium]|nr:CDP-alcohol phosphatidyltransferase family protein [Ignavibacteriota bacterium]
MKKEIFYISNLLSVFRIVLIIPVCFLFFSDFEHNKYIILCVLLLMYVTDLLDGYLARKLNQVSELGKIIDPVADKLVVGVIAILMFIKGLIPLWFIIIVVLRDLLILIFGLFLKRKKKVVLMSNYPGKVAVFTIGLALVFSIFKDTELLRFISSLLYYVSTLLIIYSSYLYYKRFKQT